MFLEQNRQFADLGWEVIPFCMRHPSNFETKWSDYFVEEIEFGSDYSIWQQISRVPKVIYSREAQRKIESLVKAVKPSVSHAHNVYHHISPSIFSTLHQAGIPSVLTLHDLKLACPAYLMLTHDGVCERCKGGKLHNVVVHRCIKNSRPLSFMVMIEAWVNKILGSYAKHVDRFVVPSRFHINKLVEWGWERKRFSYVPNFVSLELEGIEMGTPGNHLLYIGRLRPEKGLKTLVLAASRSGVPVKIAGTGPDEAELRSLVAKTSAPLEFLGYLSGTDLTDQLKAARAVVLPSECYENAPMTLLESYGFFRPVIGAEIGGIPELIRPGETGFTFESANVDALAEAMGQVASLPDSKVLEMGKTGRQWVSEDFTTSRYRDRVLEVYRDLGVDC